MRDLGKRLSEEVGKAKELLQKMRKARAEAHEIVSAMPQSSSKSSGKSVHPTDRVVNLSLSDTLGKIEELTKKYYKGKEPTKELIRKAIEKKTDGVFKLNIEFKPVVSANKLEERKSSNPEAKNSISDDDKKTILSLEQELAYAESVAQKMASNFEVDRKWVCNFLKKLEVNTNLYKKECSEALKVFERLDTNKPISKTWSMDKFKRDLGKLMSALFEEKVFTDLSKGKYTYIAKLNNIDSKFSVEIAKSTISR